MAGPVGPFFISRDSGALIRVREVDDSYAYIETLLPAPATYSMAVADYDESFIETYKPATAEDLRQLSTANFRPPLNAPESWR